MTTRRQVLRGAALLPAALSPAAARFPAFHRLVGDKEYERVGAKLEEREHEILGQDGFEKAVQQVAALENMIGIAELAQFTPR